MASPFQPDELLSAEYSEIFRRKTYMQPEKRLVFAVLEDAIACFQKYLLAQDETGERLFREAEEWLSKETGHGLFSFKGICEVLGLNPDYLRRGLLRWKKTQLAQRPQAEVHQLHPARRSRRLLVPVSKGDSLLRAMGR